MPYSDFPPQLVYPDTPEGRAARERRLINRKDTESLAIELCPDFEVERNPLPNQHAHGFTTWCGNREAMGDRAHNWCFRCGAGFYLWRTETEVADHRRITS